MKRDLDALMTNVKGEAWADKTTLSGIIHTALHTILNDDDKLAVAEKERHFRIGIKAAFGGVVDFTAEEIASLKTRIGKVYPGVVMGRAFELLEKDFVEPETEKVATES